MKPVSKKALQAFKQWGQKGGEKRARNLSALKRQAISKQAALKRWGQHESNQVFFIPSVRLKEPVWEDPVYIEEVLSYGGLSEWKELHCIISDRPFGIEAVSLQKVLDSAPIYGVTFLWKGILKHLQGIF